MLKKVKTKVVEVLMKPVRAFQKYNQEKREERERIKLAYQELLKGEYKSIWDVVVSREMLNKVIDYACDHGSRTDLLQLQSIVEVFVTDDQARKIHSAFMGRSMLNM